LLARSPPGQKARGPLRLLCVLLSRCGRLAPSARSCVFSVFSVCVAFPGGQRISAATSSLSSLSHPVNEPSRGTKCRLSGE